MGSEHIPGPLALENVFGDDRDVSLDIVLDYEVEGEGFPIPVASVFNATDDHSVPTCQEQAKATANRLIDCYNACDGIENPKLLPKVIESLEDALTTWRREMESDSEINGSDAVEWLSNWWHDTQRVLSELGIKPKESESF